MTPTGQSDRLVQISKRTGTIERVRAGETPVIELHLAEGQYVAGVELHKHELLLRAQDGRLGLDRLCGDTAMNPREQAVLDALRKDRDESGPGLSPERVEVLGRTRYPHSVIARLRGLGHVIGVVGDLFQLGEEPASAEALSSGEQPLCGEAGLSRLREDWTGDSASVDADLTLFGSGSSHYREAA